MLLDFRKAKNTRLATHVFFFFCFSQVSQHPACLDQSIQTRKTIRYFFDDDDDDDDDNNNNNKDLFTAYPWKYMALHCETKLWYNKL